MSQGKARALRVSLKLELTPWEAVLQKHLQACSHTACTLVHTGPLAHALIHAQSTAAWLPSRSGPPPTKPRSPSYPVCAIL